MNGIPTRQQVENLRERYPVGARVVLHHMDDPYAPIPPGTKGTVTYVDDMGQIGVNWDTGSTHRCAGLAPAADIRRHLPLRIQGGPVHRRDRLP